MAIDVTYHRDENMLLFNPVAEVALLHSTPEPAATLDAVSLPASRNPTGVVLPGAQGSRLDIVVNFSIAVGDKPFGAGGGSVGFGVLCDGDVTVPAADACAANASFLIDGAGQGHLAVGRTILVNSSDALKGQANSSSFCTPATCPRVAVPTDGQISLRLLVDGSSLELYANGRRPLCRRQRQPGPGSSWWSAALCQREQFRGAGKGKRHGLAHGVRRHEALPAARRRCGPTAPAISRKASGQGRRRTRSPR